MTTTLAEPIDSTTWRRHALCAEVDAEMFFPSRSNAAGQSLEAIRICHNCPARRHCLAEALALPAHRLHVGMVAGGRYFPPRSNT